jgi:hypothetical protein
MRWEDEESDSDGGNFNFRKDMMMMGNDSSGEGYQEEEEEEEEGEAPRKGAEGKGPSAGEGKAKHHAAARAVVASPPVGSEAPSVIFRKLWGTLKAEGWSYRKGRGLVSTYYARPGKNLDNGVEGQDYFYAADDVIAFCKARGLLDAEHLEGAGASGAKASPAPKRVRHAEAEAVGRGSPAAARDEGSQQMTQAQFDVFLSTSGPSRVAPGSGKRDTAAEGRAMFTPPQGGKGGSATKRRSGGSGSGGPSTRGSLFQGLQFLVTGMDNSSSPSRKFVEERIKLHGGLVLQSINEVCMPRAVCDMLSPDVDGGDDDDRATRRDAVLVAMTGSFRRVKVRGWWW